METKQFKAVEQKTQKETVCALPPLAHSVKQACHLLGISRSTLYLEAARGKLRLVKVAGRTLVPASEIARLIGGGQ
jgi:excisionase family DNA binding protein